MQVEDKVIVVTGASKGIGAAAAAELARRGARVVLTARGVEALEATAAAIRAAGGRARAVALDVTDGESVRAAVAAILAAEGRIDCVVNNAGTGGGLGTWYEDNPDKLRALMELHVFGMERVTRAVLPSMLARGQGTIVNVVSALAWAPMSAAAGYSAAKAAVLAFSEALRGELRDTGIDLLIFAPGHTRTDGAYPLRTGQILEPADVARDLAKSITRRRRTFISGISNRNLVWLKRLFPSLAMRIITAIGLSALREVKRLPAKS